MLQGEPDLYNLPYVGERASAPSIAHGRSTSRPRAQNSTTANPPMMQLSAAPAKNKGQEDVTAEITSSSLQNLLLDQSFSSTLPYHVGPRSFPSPFNPSASLAHNPFLANPGLDLTGFQGLPFDYSLLQRDRDRTTLLRHQRLLLEKNANPAAAQQDSVPTPTNRQLPVSSHTMTMALTMPQNQLSRTAANVPISRETQIELIGCNPGHEEFIDHGAGSVVAAPVKSTPEGMAHAPSSDSSSSSDSVKERHKMLADAAIARHLRKLEK